MALRKDEADLSTVTERLKGHKLKSFTPDGNIKFFEVLNNFTNLLYNHSIDEAAKDDLTIVDNNHVNSAKHSLYHSKTPKTLEWKEFVAKELLIPIGIGLLFVSTSIIIEILVDFVVIKDFLITILCITIPILVGAVLLIAGIIFRFKSEMDSNLS